MLIYSTLFIIKKLNSEVIQCQTYYSIRIINLNFLRRLFVNHISFFIDVIFVTLIMIGFNWYAPSINYNYSNQYFDHFYNQCCQLQKMAVCLNAATQQGYITPLLLLFDNILYYWLVYVWTIMVCSNSTKCLTIFSSSNALQRKDFWSRMSLESPLTNKI